MLLICTAITRQIEHKLLKRGFQFNVMVVGALSYSEGPLSGLLWQSYVWLTE